MPPTSKRLHREDWLNHALETLDKQGVEGLYVEPLARSLGVTPGSFYWHFEDRQAMLDAVADHVSRYMLEAMSRSAESTEGSPANRLLSLMEEISLQDRGRYEKAVRGWASTDPKIMKIVKEVDQKRLGYMTRAFEEIGFERE
jgi:AcrR family transcriptional regulator